MESLLACHSLNALRSEDSQLGSSWLAARWHSEIPLHPAILYAVVAQQSVGDSTFLGSIIRGLNAARPTSSYVLVRSWLNPQTAPVRWEERVVYP